MGVSGGDVVFPECGQHGGVVDVEVFADSREGPAEVVEVDGVVDLVGGEAAAAHRDVVSVEDGADCPPVDAESRAEFIHGGSGLVTGDEFLDLVCVELACPSGLGSVDG